MSTLNPSAMTTADLIAERKALIAELTKLEQRATVKRDAIGRITTELWVRTIPEPPAA